MYASFTLRRVYIALSLTVARFLITTLGRARDAAIECWMSGISLFSVHRSCHGISLYSVHRSCHRLALRLAIVSLWGESYAIKDLTRLPSRTTSSRWQVDKEAIGLSRVQQFSHLCVARPYQISVNSIFKHIHTTSINTIVWQFVPFIYHPL